MKLSPLILAGMVLLSACKKHDPTPPPNPYDSKVKPYYKEVVIKAMTPSGNPASFQHALGYFQSKDDVNTQIMVASYGPQEYGARGFRITSINKTTGSINYDRSFDLEDKYHIQFESCATMDNEGYIWVGGHSFIAPDRASLFLIKLDKSGNIAWSNSFSNNSGWRAYSLITLHNGDLAFLAKTSGGLGVFRITTSGQSVWYTAIGYTYGGIDDDYYGSSSIYSPEYRGLVETADGSIYLATSSNSTYNGVGGSEKIYRLDASGKLQWARVFTLDGNTAPVRPVQLINAGDGQLLMADQHATTYGGPSPFFALLSLNGDVLRSRGRPFNAGGIWPSNLNEVSWYEGNLYFSSNGNREIDTYVIDGSLKLKSATKTRQVKDNRGTEQGGISLFDAADRALYYVFNFDGKDGQSNGFGISRNDAIGKPCDTTDVNPPTTLLLEDMHLTVAADKIDTTIYGLPVVFAPLTWRQWQPAPLTVQDVCGK